MYRRLQYIFFMLSGGITLRITDPKTAHPTSLAPRTPRSALLQMPTGAEINTRQLTQRQTLAAFLVSLPGSACRFLITNIALPPLPPIIPLRLAPLSLLP